LHIILVISGIIEFLVSLSGCGCPLPERQTPAVIQPAENGSIPQSWNARHFNSSRFDTMTRTSTLSVCVIGLCVALSPASSPAGLIAHWTGDGSAVDATGNGHNGSLFGGAGYGSGVFGQAFQFSGNSYVEVPGNDALEPSVISVALWVNAAPGAGLRLLADTSHGTTTTEGGWALQINGNNTADFAYGNGTAFPHISSTAIVADNAFHHVVGTLEGATMRIYVDGVLSGENPSYSGTPTDSIQNNGNVRLGRHFNLNRQLTGRLDDVRIYNHALSQAEVSSLHGAAAVPEPSALAFLGVAACLMLFRRRNRGGPSGGDRIAMA
jgi:Concanavalin A-like lectin/glucanases superfamily